MKTADARAGLLAAAFCVTGVLTALPACAAPDIPQGFDTDGERLFTRFNETPLSMMTGTGGTRTLETYYGRRQYPGSPPMIPHEVPLDFAKDTLNCLACHGQGGYDPVQEAYAPVTPHPDYENCQQCHVPQRTKALFKETDWQSISPPKLGRPEMGGSPPPIPHSLQLRSDCIACHAGNAAVTEIRVSHAARGNCRQCHVPMSATEPRKEFTRTNEPEQGPK
jgi:cytochrome c-type protein NapB